MTDSALTALALVEALLMEDGQRVHDIARTTPPEEMGALLSSLATLLAATWQGQHGTVGALERVTDYRNAYLAGAAQ